MTRFGPTREGRQRSRTGPGRKRRRVGGGPHFVGSSAGLKVKEIEPHQENGENWRCLWVKFPTDIPTHNGFQAGGEQTFFFNEKGLLQRLDYVAVGPTAPYCFDHATFGWLVFPTLRRVVSRPPSGPRVNAPTSALLQITDVVVND